MSHKVASLPAEGWHSHGASAPHRAGARRLAVGFPPRRSLIVAGWFVALLGSAPGDAQVQRLEVHPFRSTTLTDQEFLTGQKKDRPTVIAGELRIPKPGTDRLPAVVLVHGSGGISSYVDDWAQFLNSMGVATFVFDSFTPRSIVSTLDDKDQLGWLTMIVDAYRALDEVAKHPRIDPAKIAIMGFSIGGHVALYASLKRFQQMHGSPGVTFAAYIPFYPPCERRYLKDVEVSDKPIRIFHGAADDFVPITPCRAYVERLRKAGADARLTEYASAYHVFDWAALKTPAKFSQAQTARHCRIEEASDGRLINSETKQTFTWKDPCVERGGTFAYNAVAHSEAKNAVKGLVDTVLKSK